MRVFTNRAAKHDYFFLDEIEAGIALVGTEIKSIRAGRLNFKDSFARVENGEVWLLNLHISPYDKGNIFNHDPERKRKLLLNRHEIRRLTKKTEEQGLTLIPKEIYINEAGICKVMLTLAKGKKRFDKRDDIQKRDLERENARRRKDEER